MGLRAYQKALLFWGVFLTLYFGYKALPIFPLSLICATGESNFQHYKAAFVAWLLASFVEYLVLRRALLPRGSFFFSRLQTAIFLPWMVFLLWYTAPALHGRWSTIPLEILWANTVTLAVALLAAVLEQGMAQMVYTRSLRTVVTLLAVTSIVLYVVFTFRLPWADVFVEPAWRIPGL